MSGTFRVRSATWHQGQPDEQRGARIKIKLPGARPAELFVPEEHLVPLADALVDIIENKEN
ncbi:hypothetical protein [Kocuria sp. SM24M-10]|uniref:hypothetical protein n=1 Tax=Kocuria sp. SM24M-10 TaxID=1660349 RepID=UPI00064B80C7|nr:hypothetical protein [Kocuria sp. SM24M-10]KLU10623.1 hypothetical protein ABL57_05630 [Kocuria sp. SM24M-10]